ncbi:hypothetical protein [Klebsiella variicola]|uniref:hypothetical protein n=1 Tax=Klebsiella variicola TaxID=244366 RepID=UPI000E2CA7E4|nr:hypothetical protein [Klebsiella variicola]SXD84464.1 Uncharacterised protein [Klebsiella variicola]
MLTAKVKFYNINRCGYYKYSSKVPDLSNTSDVLLKLNDWASDGREFINTGTYKAEKDEDILNTYFCGLATDKRYGDHLLALWAEVPNDSGVVYGMPPLAKPGKVDMLTTGFDIDKAIPGFPCYFWFIPQLNVFASIKFEHSLMGKGHLDNYLNGYLANKSPYRVFDEDNKVIGFSVDGKKSNDSSKLKPNFYAVGMKYDEVQAELISNLSKITKILKREKITYRAPDDRKIIERVFSGLLKNAPDSTQERTLLHEMEFKPTETELKSIIKSYNSLENTSSIRNVGFKYSDGRAIWLSGANVSFEIELNVRRKDNHIIPPGRLLSAIIKRRDELITKMKTPPTGG